MTHMRRYRITTRDGGELGEGEGSTRPEALLHLYRLAQVGGVTLTNGGRRLRFERDKHLPNVDGVRFERLA